MQGGLLLGVPLSPHTVARLVLYLRELTRWNEKINLTALKTDADIVSKHFLDSLAAFKLIMPESGLIRPGPSLRLLDVGTGAGFPGLVLKLQAPELAVTLLEPSLKKAAFLHHMIGLLGLSGVAVITKRIEGLTEPGQSGPYDFVTTRAVAPEVVLADAPRLLAPGGRVLLYRMSPLEEAPPAYRLVRQVSFTLPFTNDPRTLTLLEPAPTSSPSPHG
jgi:16S rRNA (guanine527-N7)-methyltransferase